MKPVLGMEGEKPTIITVAGMPESTAKEQTTKSKKNRVIQGVAIGLVAMVIIATVVGLSVYFGAKVTRDNYKEAWQTFRATDGKVVEEKVTITDNEVDINVPNEMEVVYDYKHGLVVYRLTNQETKIPGACYAKYLNDSQAPSPKDADKYTDKSEIALQEESESEPEKWQTTTKQVPRYMISVKVEKMCEDTDIYWMEKVEDDGISKRSIATSQCLLVYYKWYCYTTWLAGVYYCEYYYWCTENGISWYYLGWTHKYVAV